MTQRFHLLICLVAAGSVLTGYADVQAQNVLYVKEGSTGVDCSSWSEACGDLQEALGIAQSGDEVWVAAGTYTPTEPSGDRYATFQLISEVALYGGFIGNETQRNQRDWEANETILSGDLNGDDGPDFANYDENSKHVVTGSGTDGSAIIDGFTITGGHAQSPYPHQLGGGMFNDGGSPTVAHCTFIENMSTGGGGVGMCNLHGSSPTVTNCTFSGNWAKQIIGSFVVGGFGGGMCNYASSPTVTNCIFSGNLADLRGGAMANFGGSLKLTNCTISGNTGEGGFGGGQGGAFYFSHGSYAMITNCILWGNIPVEVYVDSAAPVITHSDVQGGWPGEGNIDSDPLFAGSDLHLPPGSPCIDSGYNLALPHDISDLDEDGDITEPTPFDLEGTPRLANDTVDMGAYELPVDCNGNGLPDMQDILDGSSADCSGNWVPDECEADCNGNGTADSCDIVDGVSEDCNQNYIPDECDIAEGTSQDNNGNGIPDECEQPQDVLYVKQGATGVDCSSWSQACNDLQDALAIAVPGDEIWVAAGSYTPAGPGGSSVAVFQIISGVALYGGFVGNETERNQRDWRANETILSGDLNGNDGPGFTNNDENSYRVVKVYFSDSVTLDGFTISGGNADGSGIFSPYKSFAGMQIDYGDVTVRNCVFVGNSANASGGAMGISRGHHTVSNCAFIGNRASSSGGVFISLSSPTVTNCTFVGNSASMGAAAINASGGTRVTNCTFVGNSGERSFISGGSPRVTNCIFWDDTRFQISYGNTMVSYSCVKGGYDGVGNIDDDPLFGDAENGDVRLLAFSPAIDTGDNTVVTEPTDLDGNPRIVDANADGVAVVDMGAYETPYDPDDCNGNGVPDVDDLANGTSPDCNSNAIPDECDIFAGSSQDCNANSVPDECDTASGSSGDCNGNGVPDECEDCNDNGIADECDIAVGTSQDCDGNNLPDECDILAGTSPDCDLNGVPDECDISGGTSGDCNGNDVPDLCDIGLTIDQWAHYVIDFSSQYSEPNYSAAQALGEPDVYVYGDSPNAWAPAATWSVEFITLGFSPVFADGVTIRETYGNGFVYQVDVLDLDNELHYVWAGYDPSEPGEVVDFLVTWPQIDFLVKGVKIYVFGFGWGWPEIDAVQLHSTIVSTSDDCNENGVPDECEFGAVPWSLSNGPLPNDCNGNGVLDECDIANGTSEDCNENDIPDECDIADCPPDDPFCQDCNENGIPDSCDLSTCEGEPWCDDCNSNGILDECDLYDSGGSEDCNDNHIPDECEKDPCPICDLNGDGIVDRIDLGIMRRCLSQVDPPNEEDCEVADLDGDGQVTWRDWKLFIECYRQYIGPSQIGSNRALAPMRE